MFLPHAPSREEKYLFLHTDKVRLYTAGALSALCLILGNLLFIWAHPTFAPYVLFSLLLFLYLGISYFVGFLGTTFDFIRHRVLVNAYLEKSESAIVDIYLPVCGEPHSVIRNTWNHVRDLRDVHGIIGGSIRVYVLDDGHSPELHTLASEYGFTYITREGNELKKAGNLRHAFPLTCGEFIVIFDADFCPRRDFLIETLPYLLDDPRVAIVQTPQFFVVDERQTPVQNGAAQVQELFYRLIQVNRSSLDGAICVGTNAVYRREALAPFGGTAAMPYSEDVHTGFQVQNDGWRVKYLPVNLAMGVCPTDLRQFFPQQYRWALGSISLFFSRKFWHSRLNVTQRICYLSGMLYYMATGLSVVFASLPSLFLLIWHPDGIFWWNLIFSIPSLIFSTLYMHTWQKLGLSWSALHVRQVSYVAHLFALFDFLRGRVEEWRPTGAVLPGGAKGRTESFFRLYPLWSWGTAAVIFGLVTYRVVEGTNPLTFTLLLLLTMFNLVIQAPWRIHVRHGG